MQIVLLKYHIEDAVFLSYFAKSLLFLSKGIFLFAQTQALKRGFPVSWKTSPL